MSIEVTLPAASIKPFPKLMSNGNEIVLFTGPETGTELTPNTGHFSECWNVDCFTDYNEEITIKNI